MCELQRALLQACLTARSADGLGEIISPSHRFHQELAAGDWDGVTGMRRFLETAWALCDRAHIKEVRHVATADRGLTIAELLVKHTGSFGPVSSTLRWWPLKLMILSHVEGSRLSETWLESSAFMVLSEMQAWRVPEHALVEERESFPELG